jgi:phosphoglycolate phosphatase-like HAD superfamily hydrolase
MGLILDQFGLRPYFSPVVTADTVQHPKPHPESLYWILSKWELTTESVVFIGDTDVDCRTAAAAGVPFWSFHNGDLAAERHIRDHREVADAIEEMIES